MVTLFGMVIIESAVGLEASIGILIILPLIVAAMIEGQIFARRYGCRPSNTLCWIASLRMTAMVVLICLAVIIPRLMLYGQPGAVVEPAYAIGRVIGVLFIIGIVWGLLRLGYAIGLATELKGQQFSDE